MLSQIFTSYKGIQPRTCLQLTLLIAWIFFSLLVPKVEQVLGYCEKNPSISHRVIGLMMAWRKIIGWPLEPC